MELTPELYTENPFELDAHFRIAEVSKMNEKDLYALFVKNMIAFVYFKTDYYDCEVRSPNLHGIPIEIEQIHLYQSYFRGGLKTKYEDPICSSPLLLFCDYENDVFLESTSIDAIYYRNFIAEHAAIFERIDILANQTTNTNAGKEFLTYLTAYHAVYPHVDVLLMGNALEAYFIAVCKSLCCSYVYHFDESGLFPEDFQGKLEAVYLAMKYDLLEVGEREKIIVFSKRWLTQRFKEFSITKHVQFPIYEMEGAFVFASVLEQFDTYFSFALSTTTTKEYPTYIFSSYEAFHLFDTLAKGLSIKVAVSYVYRLLHEKDLIVVKDTPFRTWFNKQSYSIQLTTATETLQNSTSSEREQYVALVAELLGVNI